MARPHVISTTRPVPFADLRLLIHQPLLDASLQSRHNERRRASRKRWHLLRLFDGCRENAPKTVKSEPLALDAKRLVGEVGDGVMRNDVRDEACGISVGGRFRGIELLLTADVRRRCRREGCIALKRFEYVDLLVDVVADERCGGFNEHADLP